MNYRILLAGVAGVVLASSLAMEVAAKKTPPPGPFIVSFAGCPMYSDIEGGCLTIKKHSVTYEINAIKSKFDMKKHLGISGTGTWYPESGTTCQMGRRLVKIKWQYTRQKCLGG